MSFQTPWVLFGLALLPVLLVAYALRIRGAGSNGETFASPRMLALVLWGRDELHTGDMWNSNSLIAWLIATAGLSTEDVQPPPRGRAPGWHARLEVARRAHGAYERNRPPLESRLREAHPRLTRRWRCEEQRP